MQTPQAAVVLFVLFVLPLLRRYIAEKNAAAEGAKSVDGAEAIDLKGAAEFVPCPWSACGERS